MRRRDFLMALGAGGSAAAMARLRGAGAPPKRKPTFIFILADDLGYAELGCYGQKKIRTPHIDRLASEGMRFTDHYAGDAVCAPSRCVLLTGKHTGHAYIRSNREVGGWGPDEPEGQLPIPAGEVTLAERLKPLGYATCAIGKWGLGGPGSSGHPCYQGFDRFYGYLCQRVAHNYYPTHLWRNHDVDVLGNPYFSAHQRLEAPPADRSGYDRFKGKVYAPDRMIEEALKFIRRNRDRPFFLYYATPVPHMALQVPEDSLRLYAGKFGDKPYLGEKGYLPHPEPRAAYAAMVTRMDAHVGRILALLEELGLDGETVVLFSSDNGPTFNGGTDSAFFESAGPLRGLKASLFEGGIRVPMIARWPGRIAAGTTTHLISGFQDIAPTLVELAGGKAPGGLDGISLVPTLLGEPARQDEHAYLYWELGRSQAVRAGPWKLVRTTTRRGETRAMLFDLDEDLGEKRDLSRDRPQILARMVAIARSARVPSKAFPSPYDDGR